MARRHEHTQIEIKELVLLASETIIKEEGLGALKVRQIAMEIGYTVGSIYMVFKNMGDLIIHVKARTLDEMIAVLNKSIIHDMDIASQIIAYSKAYLQFAKENFNRWLMLSAYYPATENFILPAWYQQKNAEKFKTMAFLFQQLNPQSNHYQQAAKALLAGIEGICLAFLSAETDNNAVDDKVLLLTENFIKGWQASEK